MRVNRSMAVLCALVLSVLCILQCGGGSSSGEMPGATVEQTPAKPWTWMSGSDDRNISGVYGTQGTGSTSNYPGARSEHVTWIDSSGNLWLFGGSQDANYYNDLWKYTPSSGEWTWVSGSSSANQTGVYGTKGVGSISNYPGARLASNAWIDSSGNLWLFGGYGYGESGGSGYMNDLWKYEPTNGKWTWVGGSKATNQCGVYGTQGTGSTDNYPGARRRPVSWIDSSGNLWLFGGLGYGESGSASYLNDLWEYEPSNGKWTWVTGSKTTNQCGVYGTQGAGSTSNCPGARYRLVVWIDSSGSLWLFGGFGYGESGSTSCLNDLWRYEPSNGKWTWVGGSKTGNQTGVYGTQGTAGTGNYPGGRYGGLVWRDSSANLWFFGGGGYGSSGSEGVLNDLWKYKPSTGEWTWVSGSSTVNQAGVYGTKGTGSLSNFPGGRRNGAAWFDSSGSLWLLGGYGYSKDAANSFLNDLWKYTL